MAREEIKIDDKERLDIIWICLATAICFAAVGLVLPPLGIIHASVLILVAQFLVLVVGILFNSATVAKQVLSLTKLIKQNNE